MVRGNVSRLTIGPDGAISNMSTTNLNHSDHHNFSPYSPYDFSLLPRPDQSLDAKLLSLWMTVFAVFGGTAALAWLVLSTWNLVKAKAHKLLGLAEPSTSRLDVRRIISVAAWAVVQHLVITLVWYIIPDASFAAAGLPQVAACSARLIVQVEIAVSLVVGMMFMLLKLAMD